MNVSDNTAFQAQDHAIVVTEQFRSIEEYILYLMHLSDYESTAQVAKDLNVLDIGCNCGYGSHHLSAEAASVIGVDVSEQAISEAKKRYSSANLSFQCVDGRQLPFPDDQFDLVTSFQVIEHIDNYDNYFREIKRVLQPEGIFVLSTPNAAIRVKPGHKPWNKFHVHEFLCQELKDMLVQRFAFTEVLECFAAEEAYRVEYNRCMKLRDAQSITGGRKTWVRSIIPFIPSCLVSLARRIKMGSGSSKCLHLEQMSLFSTQQFFYKNSCTDESLNLIAICGTDQSAVQRAANIFLQKQGPQ